MGNVLEINSTGFEEDDLVVNVTISVNGKVLESKAFDRHERFHDIDNISPEDGEIMEYVYFNYTPHTINESLVITLTGYQYDAWSIKIYADLPVNVIKSQEPVRIISIVLFFTAFGMGVCFAISTERTFESDTDEEKYAQRLLLGFSVENWNNTHL